MKGRLPLAVAACSVALLAASPAAGAFSITSMDTSIFNPGGTSPGSSELTAGAHPDVTVGLRFPTTTDDGGATIPDGNVRRVSADLPAGLVVDPTKTSTCRTQLLNAESCPVDSQVGVIEVSFADSTVSPLGLFNIETQPGVPARFGFTIQGNNTFLDARVRTGGDYGLSADLESITEARPITGAAVTLWGVPADPVHDAARNNRPSTLPPRAQVSNPTSCTGSGVFRATAASWQEPATVFAAADGTSPDGDPYEFTECDRLPFGPSATVKPTTSAPDSPTGLDLSVTVPQSDAPGTRATSHLRDLRVTLPPGMAVNPSAAGGLGSCSPAQIALASAAAPACPANASIGTATISTPLQADPLSGRVYLAAQNDNPFGSLLALYVVARGNGVVLKLPGKIDADPATGQLIAMFRDNPQLPFSRLDVHLDDGPGAALVTPTTCGPQSATVDLSPWSGGAGQTSTTGFSIDCGGLGAFAPTFDAGTRSPTAGLSSPLLVTVDRPDRQAALNRLSLRLPTGLLASLRGVRRCASAQADAGTCDALSRVGGATVLAGAGPNPFSLPGDVFLTGPYKGAPFGLAVRVRAVAGPLDLGTVVVRQALFIDPDDTHVDVVSDPLPTILQGIPIRLRSLRVAVDRRGFALNPTSCAAKSVRGNLGAVTGQNASVAVRFQVGSCDGLELSPRLALRLGGRGKTLRDGGHPSLKAILTQPGGQSNLKRAEVKLPLSLALDPDNAQTLCEFAEGRKAAPTCPKGSVVGTAKARTPLLGKTLSGPVYFVKGQRTDPKTKRVIKTLPTLVVPLSGDGVRINLRAKTAVSGGRLVATFDPIPDAPVSRFDFDLKGGSNGILVANSSVCSKSRALGIGIRGHNNELAKSAPTLAASCN